MKNVLCNAYGVGLFKPLIVSSDNISNMNTYEKLNTITNNDWSYTIDNILYNVDNSYNVVISLFIRGRVMSGVGSDISIKKATDLALDMAYDMLFSRPVKETKIEVNTLEEKESVNEFTNLSEYVSLDKEQEVVEEEFSTFDEIDEIETSIVSCDNDDDECPIPGSDITNKQIRFMNEFKEHNQIDTDEKFDYYIKTWASNVAVDDINTKKELIQAGYDTLENFIKWIKVMQPTLEKGIVSPI